MVISKEEGIKCNIKLENTTLEQVSKYKYLGSRMWTAFWQNKELMRRNISLNTKDKNFKLLCVFNTKLWL